MGKNVLLVDDDPHLLTSLRRTIRRLPMECTIHTAADGAAALECVRSARIDIVVTDILMPESDGLEAIVAIHREYPDIRIVAMSGGWPLDGDYDVMKAAQALGAAHTLRKPFTPDELLEALRGGE